MDQHPTTTAEAERLLGIAENLLQSRDLAGSREFALLAQETDPLLEASDQILAITDVLLTSERRMDNTRHHDWYAILQTDPRSVASDPDLLKKNYRRLALLLHPDKNDFPLADTAFNLVANAWAALSHHQQDKNKDKEGDRFWTACPYCYVLYEYPRVYEDCCLRCQRCKRAFQAAEIPAMPEIVPEKEAYYFCWGFFPLGLSAKFNGSESRNVDNGSNGNNQNKNDLNSGYPNWTPGMFVGGITNMSGMAPGFGIAPEMAVPGSNTRKG